MHNNLDVLFGRILTLMKFLSPEERVEIFDGCHGTFCADCGKELSDEPCPCWHND